MSDQRTIETRPPSPAALKEVIEAERQGLPFIYWRSDDGGQQLVQLGEDRWRLTVGRRADSDIPLVSDAEVSRAHALLERVSGQWTLVDDGLSRNGSFVNGSRVQGRTRLRDRDRMCFGRTQIVYREPAAAETPDSTASVAGDPLAVPLSEMQRKVLIALCRPVNDSAFAPPATNRQIAEEVFLSVDAVKAHLRLLFERFGLSGLPQNEKRSRLAARALIDGILKPRDF